MNYDTMSAHEILVMAVTTAYEENYLPTIESAFRHKVIEEASIQTFHIKTKEPARNEYGVWNECEVNGVKQDRISALRHLPDGDYALVPIPKEVQP